MSYYDWMHNTQKCGKCNWAGLGSEASMGEAMAERAADLEFKTPSQLPDLESGPATLIWDVIYGEGFADDSFIVILHGDREIWREISFLEEYERFGEIATILRGSRFSRAGPTRSVG